MNVLITVTTYLPFSSLLTFRDQDEAKFRLGVETITAINDGGLGVAVNDGRHSEAWNIHSHKRPVMSLEAIH